MQSYLFNIYNVSTCNVRVVDSESKIHALVDWDEKKMMFIVFAADCVDHNESCLYYEDTSCKSPYVPWAKANCPLRCDFCPGEWNYFTLRLSKLNNLDL